MSIFSKLFKSGKRKANEAAIKEAVDKGEGSVTVTSRRADNPKGGDALKRGSKVNVVTKKKQVGTKYVDDSSEEKTIQGGFKFSPEDRSEKSNVRTARETTTELGKQYDERPAKTKLRMEAQKNKQTSYYAGPDKGVEHSGVYKFTPDKKVTIRKSHKEPIMEDEKQITTTSAPKKEPRLRARKTRVSGGGQNKYLHEVTWSRRKKPDVTLLRFKTKTKTPGSKR